MLVVADTSVLVNLCRIGYEHLLPALYREIRVPLAVLAEFERLARNTAKFRDLQIPRWVQMVPVATSHPTLESWPDLNEGEKEAIALALQLQADAVLIDEMAGRAAAAKLGLVFVGIIGILLQAKLNGLVPEIKFVLDRLRAEPGFWISEAVRAEALRRAGEVP